MNSTGSRAVVSGVPVLKSIVDLPEFTEESQQGQDRQGVQPIAKTYAASGTKLFAALAAVDGGQALAQFAQTMLRGKTDAKAALTTLQQGLEQVVKS